MDKITIDRWSRVALCALVVTLAGACEREDWKPDVLASRSVGHDETVLRLGRETYSTYCVGCHGENGDGNGPAARFLDPRPRDLRAGIIKFAAVEAGQLPHDADLYRVVKAGLNGTSMSGWEFMADRKINNPVVLTGDNHMNWANELRVDDRKMDTPVVATEIVGTSIASGGDGEDRFSGHDKLLSDNPFIKFHNRQRGYVRCTLTQKTWTSDYMVVDKVTTPDGKVTKRTSLILENGSPIIRQA